MGGARFQSHDFVGVSMHAHSRSPVTIHVHVYVLYVIRNRRARWLGVYETGLYTTTAEKEALASSTSNAVKLQEDAAT